MRTSERKYNGKIHGTWEGNWPLVHVNYVENWLGGQLPVPSWTPLILPDEILSEELSPQSPTPTEVCLHPIYQLFVFHEIEYTYLI